MRFPPSPEAEFDKHPPALGCVQRLLRERPVLYLSGICDPPPRDGTICRRPPQLHPQAHRRPGFSQPPGFRSSCGRDSGPWCPRGRRLPSTSSSATPGFEKPWSSSSHRWWSKGIVLSAQERLLSRRICRTCASPLVFFLPVGYNGCRCCSDSIVFPY